MTPDEAAAYVDAAAAALDLPIGPYRAGVVGYFALAAAMNAAVDAFPLGPRDEPGVPFPGAVPVAPRPPDLHFAACDPDDARARVDASLATIARTASLNAYTAVLDARARDRAARLDRSGDRALPLFGMPFAVKNLFDVAGLATRAGSRIERDAAPATRDAVVIERLEAAGAVLVGALNMDEYAYGFTTENAHDGTCRNPHDPTRICGGSSGGSGAAVAAGTVPLALGSDTNGSIRVPASLCGTFGLKPTFGRLSRRGSYPFVASLDHVGPLARSARDLALAYDAMQGPDPDDAGSAQRPVEPTVDGLDAGTDGLRIAVLGGWFHEQAGPDARAAVARVAAALGASDEVVWTEAEAVRAAAFVVTNADGAALHLANLRTRAGDFGPLARDRLLAGALVPAAWVARAQRVRRAAAVSAARLFERFDVLIAAATPCAAPPIGTETLEIGGRMVPARPHLGVLTQPLSAIGVPVAVVPLFGVTRGADAHLPIGVQLVAAPWREDRVLRAARALEHAGVAEARLPDG